MSYQNLEVDELLASPTTNQSLSKKNYFFIFGAAIILIIVGSLAYYGNCGMSHGSSNIAVNDDSKLLRFEATSPLVVPANGFIKGDSNDFSLAEIADQLGLNASTAYFVDLPTTNEGVDTPTTNEVVDTPSSDESGKIYSVYMYERF